MNVLDENIVANQRQRLKGWHIPIRQVGYDLRQQGLKDDAIIPFLLELRRPTFFTRDLDFYDRNLCHKRYCLVCLVVGQYEVAAFIRRILRHPEFDTYAKRMGKVVRVAQTNISLWQPNTEQEMHLTWQV